MGSAGPSPFEGRHEWRLGSKLSWARALSIAARCRGEMRAGERGSSRWLGYSFSCFVAGKLNFEILTRQPAAAGRPAVGTAQQAVQRQTPGADRRGRGAGRRDLLFNAGFDVRASLATLLADVRSGMKHDVLVMLEQQIDRERALQVSRSVGNVARIETWSGGRGELQSQLVAAAGGVGIVALPHDSDLLRPRLVACCARPMRPKW